MPICQSDTTETEKLIQRISELEEENENLRSLEQVVRRNTSLFEALLANNSGAIALVGPHRRIVRVVRALDGFSADELAGTLVDSLVPFEDHAVLLDCYDRILRRRCSRVEFEVRTYRPDGSLRWVAVTLTDMLDNPNVQAIVCNVDDVTERKHGELILAELAFLAEFTEWAVFSHDPEGKILTWNPAAEIALGYCAAEIVGHHVSKLVPTASERAHCEDPWQPGEFCAKRVRKDGEEVSVLVKLARVLDKNGHTRAITQALKVLRVRGAGAGYPPPTVPAGEAQGQPAD